MRWENKNTCRWPVLLVISVPKIFLNGQFYFNLSSKTWLHVFLEHSVDKILKLLTFTRPSIIRRCKVVLISKTVRFLAHPVLLGAKILTNLVAIRGYGDDPLIVLSGGPTSTAEADTDLKVRCVLVLGSWRDGAMAAKSCSSNRR